MARIFLKNISRQDITLSVAGADPVTIPAAVDGPAGFAPGTASADDSFVTAAKKSPVVKHYFDAGVLDVMKEPKETKAKKAEEEIIE